MTYVRRDKAAPVTAAKIYFSDTFSSGVGPEFKELQVYDSDAVQALLELLEQYASTSPTWYDRTYPNMPFALQRCLPPPSDRRKMLTSTLWALEYYGSNAVPAMPHLVHLFESNVTDEPIRSLVLRTFRGIGPAAHEAIPVLLLRMNPTNASLSEDVGLTLPAIDPSGDYTDAVWCELLKQPKIAAWTTNMTDHWLDFLRVPESDYVFLKEPSYERWEWNFSMRLHAMQILGSIRFQAARTVPEIRAHLRDTPYLRTRMVAILALGRIGPQASEALPDLRLLYGDESEQIREMATNAVRAIER